MGSLKVSAAVTPERSMHILSRLEVNRLLDASQTGLYDVFRRCALAVLNCGSHEDDTTAILNAHADFDVRVIQQCRGIKLEVMNAPDHAFVDGVMVRGIKEHLFSVLRDIMYIASEIRDNPHFDLSSPEGTTNAIFSIARNAKALRSNVLPNMVVCWGGHSIGREEYEFTKQVGYELGLRGLDICTGCGPGAMKGPMKGAAIGHAKQRFIEGRYLGITEPGIIASESPNPMVNQLMIMPDIEKRLEAFVRIGHGIIVFPGGAGTAEEVLYLLGVLMHPKNQSIPFPVVFAAGACSADYFNQLDAFIVACLGEKARNYYQIIIDDPQRVASIMAQQMEAVSQHRRDTKDAYYFNWSLNIERDFQMPFEPTHDNMARLNLSRDQPVHELAANLRRVFSGIVAGNVKEQGLAAIESQGPFMINGDSELMQRLDVLLKSFVAQGRMKINSEDYQPCYEVVTS